MTSANFNKVIEDQINKCKDILCVKAEEYAGNDDRLHNFKCAAGLQNCDPKEALLGMMTKHTVSISDMCRDGKSYGIDIWNEKITDAINYLLLLKGLVAEEYLNKEAEYEQHMKEHYKAEVKALENDPYSRFG